MDSTSPWSITLPTEQRVWSREPASHAWSLSIHLCMAYHPTWPPLFLCWMVSSSRHRNRGETDSNTQPKPLPTFLMMPLHKSQCGLLHNFRGLNGSGGLKCDFLSLLEKELLQAVWTKWMESERDQHCSEACLCLLYLEVQCPTDLFHTARLGLDNDPKILFCPENLWLWDLQPFPSGCILLLCVLGDLLPQKIYGLYNFFQSHKPFHYVELFPTCSLPVDHTPALEFSLGWVFGDSRLLSPDAYEDAIISSPCHLLHPLISPSLTLAISGPLVWLLAHSLHSMILESICFLP